MYVLLPRTRVARGDDWIRTSIKQLCRLLRNHSVTSPYTSAQGNDPWLAGRAVALGTSPNLSEDIDQFCP